MKAIDGDAWPLECAAYRSEALVVRSLPASLPVPAFIGSFDDGRWVALALEAIDGVPPDEPWNQETLTCAISAVVALIEAMTPSPFARPHEPLGSAAGSI